MTYCIGCSIEILIFILERQSTIVEHIFPRGPIRVLKIFYDLILLFFHLLTFLLLLTCYLFVSSFLKVNTVVPLFVGNTVDPLFI